MLDQLQRRGTIALGLGQQVDDAFGGEQLHARARTAGGTVAQQALQSCATLGANPHLGIEGESAVLPGEHRADVIRVDEPTAGEPPQHPRAHPLGDGGDVL